MGIESDAIPLFIAIIILGSIIELICGCILLKQMERKIIMVFSYHCIANIFAFIFLFDCYFHQIDVVPNMTFGIGLFILSWPVSMVFIIKLISLIIPKK